MKRYTHLLFDLDGTLWDLHKNTRLALEIVYHKHELPSELFETFFRRYHYHNDRVWALYRDGKIEKDQLRWQRFHHAFSDVGYLPDEAMIMAFSESFSEVCPRQPHLLEGARALLDQVVGKFHLSILTNGFIEIQGIKMERSGLKPYFSHVIHSEEAGVRKPHRGFFQYALNTIQAEPEHCLMIGDDWVADILGARDMGIDQLFITTTEEMLGEMSAADSGVPKRTPRHNYSPTYTVNSLSEVSTLLQF